MIIFLLYSENNFFDDSKNTNKKAVGLFTDKQTSMTATDSKNYNGQGWDRVWLAFARVRVHSPFPAHFALNFFPISPSLGSCHCQSLLLLSVSIYTHPIKVKKLKYKKQQICMK